MTDYLTPKLPARIIPVTRGTDRVFTLRRRNAAGEVVDWDSEVYVDIDIDRAAPTRVTAVVAGSAAVIRIESTVGDQTKTGTTWRAVRSAAGDPSTETPLLVGIFERNDGK